MACGRGCKCSTCRSALVTRAAAGATRGSASASACAHPARERLVNRLAGRVDRLRQRYTDVGLRAYDVFLVWTKWTGAERGEGDEHELARVALTPSPLVEDLTNLSLSPFAAGILPVGSVRLSQISMSLTQDVLLGYAVPGQAQFAGCRLLPGAAPIPPELYALGGKQPIGKAISVTASRIPQPFEFFYEVVQNDVPLAQRAKFRPYSVPFKRPGKFDWSMVLERVSEDRTRDGQSQIGEDRE